MGFLRYSSATALLGLLCVGAGISGCGAHPTPPTQRSTAVDYQYWAEETDVVFTPHSDGTVGVRQTTVVDAGDGQDASAKLTVFVQVQLRLKESDDRTGWWVTSPQISQATVVTLPPSSSDGTPPTVAETTTSDGEYQQLVVTDSGGWTAGRHRVQLEYVLSGVWVSIRGERRLVFPPGSLEADWYGTSHPGDVARFRTQDSETLHCGGDNRNFPEKTCSAQTSGTVVSADTQSGSQISADNQYYFLPTPKTALGKPVDAQFVARG